MLMNEVGAIGEGHAPVGAASRRDSLRFAAYTAAALLIAHAIAFFLHEYSHATMAWLLGFKANPLAIDYGHLNLSNVLLQQEIDENVNYGRVFGTGHGLDATLIALAGPGIGNGSLYIACALVLTRRASRMRPAGKLFLFWLALMAASNLWSYAPVRTITTHADMALAAHGLGISVWTLLPFVTIPALWAGWDLFSRVLPLVLASMDGGEPLRRTFVTTVACFIFFGVFGGVAISGSYGNISAVVSVLSVFLLFPVVLMAALLPGGIRRTTGRAAGE